MAIIRWTPLMPTWPRFSSLWDEEENWPSTTVNEGLDVYETDKEVVVKAALPGVASDKVRVTFEDGVLRISGKCEDTEEEKKHKKVIYRAQKLAAFDYTTTLPRAIEAGKIQAEMDNGVLIVKAPITAAAKPKQIVVKTSNKKSA